MRANVLGKEKLMARIKDSLGNNYSVLSNIDDNTRVIDKVKVKCLKHDCEYWVTIRALWAKRSAKGCKYCKGERISLTIGQANDFIQNINSYYKIIYPQKGHIRKDDKIKLLYIPAKRNNIITTSINNFKAGKRIRVIRSKGEIIIKRILDLSNISYIPQYEVTYKGKNLFYDFYLPDKELFIEVDGKQHRENLSFFYKNDSQYKSRISLDKIKNEFIDSHSDSLKLIRIPYDNDHLKNYILRVIRLLKNAGFNIDNDTLIKNDLFDDTEFYLDFLNYYLKHTREDSSNKFHLSESSISKICLTFWGKQKNEYVRELYHQDNEKEIAEYYLSHTREQTAKKFKIGQGMINKRFISYFGSKKSTYIGYHPNKYRK